MAWPVQNFHFRMIERHYFRDQLIKSVDSTWKNPVGDGPKKEIYAWHIEYPQAPGLPAETRAAICANPYEATSDSFYFIDGKLAMHYKTAYRYRDP